MLQIARASIYFSKSMLYIFKHTHRYTVIRYKKKFLLSIINETFLLKVKLGSITLKARRTGSVERRKVHLIFCVAHLQSTQYIQSTIIFINLPISGLD